MDQEIYDGVKEGITDETVCSEANICIIVQHEVSMYLVPLKDEQERIQAVEEVAQQAMIGLFDSDAPFHTFTVTEGTRGVIHGLVCAGLDVSYVTRFAVKGIRQALLRVDYLTREGELAMLEGVKEALDDLGMSGLEEDKALELPAYYMNQTMRFGQSSY